MDPDSPHTDQQSVKVRAPETGPLPAEEPRAIEPAATKSAVKRVRPNPLMVAGIALLAVGLVALIAFASWSYLSRQDPGGQAGTAEVPQDAVALINSSTPIPLRAPANVQDGAGAISFQPSSDNWSAALSDAHLAQMEGRYSSAISLYSDLVGRGKSGESRDALWGLASTYAAAGQRDLALRAYSLFASLDDPRASAAYVRTGQIAEQMAHFADASQAYDEYAKLGGPAANAVKLMQARLLGSDPRAETLYNGVINSNPLDPDLRQALAGLAALKSKRGDHAGARQLYERLASIQEKDPRPVLDNQGRPPQDLAADEAVAANDKAGAAKTLMDYISRPGTYPYGRYSALQTLVKIEPTVVASGTIAPMTAAQIAFDAGYYANAIGYMDSLRTNSPGSPDRPAAALLTGRAFDLLGDSASAYNWYSATVQVYPSSPQAPEAGRRAADALADQAQWDQAIGVYSQTIASYPNAGDQTALARLHDAVLSYRLGDREGAIGVITPLLTTKLSPDLKTQTLFWAAKLQKSEGNNAWQNTIKPVSTLSPGTYLDFRARSLLAGEPAGGPAVLPYSSTRALTLTVDYASEAPERAELLSWAATLTSTRQAAGPTATAVARSTGTPGGTPSATLGPADVALARLQSQPEARRAAALLDLGFETEANTAFRALAEKLRNDGDATTLAALMIYLRYNASPYVAMRVATTLSSMYQGDPTKQPRLLLKTLYPVPYYDLVLNEAQQRNIDPLVLYALMRQESQFVPNALSGADAHGLTQIIPSTGQGIAQQLGDTSYSVGDLDLPYVNIRYGAYYLASSMPQFDRKLFPTLAAYNGGPGNAARWLQGSALVDPDLFLERIDLFETADYLQVVYDNYWFYKLIYGK
jgi:soluble lytic murein transglycosylase